MEKYLIHSNELHLIDAGKIHQAVEENGGVTRSCRRINQ